MAGHGGNTKWTGDAASSAPRTYWHLFSTSDDEWYANTRHAHWLGSIRRNSARRLRWSDGTDFNDDGIIFNIISSHSWDINYAACVHTESARLHYAAAATAGPAGDVCTKCAAAAAANYAASARAGGEPNGVDARRWLRCCEPMARLTGLSSFWPFYGYPEGLGNLRALNSPM